MRLPLEVTKVNWRSTDGHREPLREAENTEDIKDFLFFVFILIFLV